MADISSWQQTVEQVGNELDPDTLGTNLYQCCSHIFHFVDQEDLKLDAAIFARILAESYRFRLWGSAYGAHDGSLDERLAGDDLLKEALFPMLGRMTETLSSLGRHVDEKRCLAETYLRAQLLQDQISSAIEM